jgi:hypothetical protein
MATHGATLRSGTRLAVVPAVMPSRAAAGVVVRASAVAGRGVFATRDIPIHTVLGRYTGERLTAAEVAARYPHGEGRYVLNAGGFFLDAVAHVDEDADWPRFLNSPYKTGRAANTRFEEGGIVRTTVKIRAGAELLIAYGGAYRGFG